MQFETQIAVRWADVDHNQHVRHSAYYDYGAHARIRFFEQSGFGMDALSALHIGPILFSEQCNFLRELRLNDTVRINLLRGDIAPNGRKWVLYHELFNSKGEKAAHLKLFGAFLDTQSRKVAAPPQALADAFHALEEGADFVFGG